jgi:HlyD family secretion protein
VGAAVVLVAAGGGVAWAMSGRTADRFTTATVAMGSVQQTVSATGTVASASRRDVSFPVAGTVASVKVGLGDTVTAGEVLASLDPTSLQSALDTANTTLQQAQQQLSDDLQSQTAGTSSTTTSASTRTTSSVPTSSATPTQPSGSSPTGKADQGSGTSPEVAKASQGVAAAQQALLAAYDAAHTAIGVSTAALADAQTACTGITGLDPSTVVPDGGTPTPAATATATPTPSPTASATAAPTAPTVSDVQALIAACQKKLTDASTAQADTKTKQQAVSDAATALDQAVAALQQALAASSSSGTGSSGTGSSSTHSSTSSTSSTSSSSSTGSSQSSQNRSSSSSSAASSGASQQGRVATAEDIISDRAAIDAAQSQVDMATQDLALVNLTSPIAGTVGAVSITVGQHVSASSTSAVITVLGTTGYVVNITIPLTSLDKLAVGQSATVLVPSTATQLTGKVSSIGILDVSSTSTPEYSLVVALDPVQEKLFDGSSAQVSIAVAGTGQVITVPTSAVHVTGQTATVGVLDSGQVNQVTVKRGAVGAQLTEITSGLTVGQTVVLADRSQALPNTSNNNQNSGLSGLTNRSTTRVGGGNFGGGGSFRGAGG